MSIPNQEKAKGEWVPLQRPPEQPEPRYPTLLIERERGLTLAELERCGLTVEATGGTRVRVGFRKLEGPRPWSRTGWCAVRLRSTFGGECWMLHEEREGGRISGILRLKGRRKHDEP